MAFSKRRTLPTARDDIIIVVANLDPHSHPRDDGAPRHAGARASATRTTFVAHDLITGASWHWGEHVYVRLGPDDRARAHRPDPEVLMQGLNLSSRA